MKERREQKPKDPYKHIRRQIPPPDFPIDSGTEYDRRLRKRKKEIIDRELKEYNYNDI